MRAPSSRGSSCSRMTTDRIPPIGPSGGTTRGTWPPRRDAASASSSPSFASRRRHRRRHGPRPGRPLRFTWPTLRSPMSPGNASIRRCASSGVPSGSRAPPRSRSVCGPRTGSFRVRGRALFPCACRRRRARSPSTSSSRRASRSRFRGIVGSAARGRRRATRPTTTRSAACRRAEACAWARRRWRWRASPGWIASGRRARSGRIRSAGTGSPSSSRMAVT